jgi:hypothetical protein
MWQSPRGVSGGRDGGDVCMVVVMVVVMADNRMRSIPRI